MKKKYLKPESLTVKIANHLMLITSNEAANPEGEVLGRQAKFYDDWDEDWEEDY